jgi:nucleoside-triphosphatase THEP1
MSSEPRPRLAAIRYERDFPINSLVHEIVAELKQRGCKVAGVVQKAESDDACARLIVVDIRTGETAVITQDRGKDAAGCKLDPRGLAEIAHCITDAVAAGVELIVVNKFGRAESEGSGLLACIADAVVAGIPLLTTVREPYLEAWQAFHGGYAVELPPQLDAILSWCTAACRKEALHEPMMTNAPA